MTLWTCLACTTRYAVGLPACPHCRSTDYEEDGAMPKITRHGGPSVAGAQVVGGAWSDSSGSDEWPDLSAEPGQQDEGGEESSPGSSSQTSPEKPETSPETSAPALPRRARTTASRSRKAPTGASTAPTTDGGPEETTSASPGEDGP